MTCLDNKLSVANSNDLRHRQHAVYINLHIKQFQMIHLYFMFKLLNEQTLK